MIEKYTVTCYTCGGTGHGNSTDKEKAEEFFNKHKEAIHIVSLTVYTEYTPAEREIALKREDEAKRKSE